MQVGKGIKKIEKFMNTHQWLQSIEDSSCVQIIFY